MTVREELIEALREQGIRFHVEAGHLRRWGRCVDNGCCNARAAIERAKLEETDTWNDWKPPMVDCTTPGRITVKRPLP